MNIGKESSAYSRNVTNCDEGSNKKTVGNAEQRGSNGKCYENLHRNELLNHITLIPLT